MKTPINKLYEIRLKICSKCPHLKRRALIGPQCTKCGCMLHLKARMATQKCPLGHWP